MSKIQVHVADDHKILIEGLTAVINTDENIEINGYSLTGKEVIDWFSKKENKADVLILDITMPIVDGIEVLTYFKEKNICQKVIVLSSYDDVSIVQEMLSLGCSGYVTKSSAGEHIIKAIKAVANGAQYFSDDIQKLLLNSFSKNSDKVTNLTDDSSTETLTSREQDILKLIINQYSTSQIAKKFNVTVYTVRTHRKNIFKKLKVTNVVGLTLYAIRNKLV